jgi:hypothetical protein
MNEENKNLQIEPGVQPVELVLPRFRRFPVH